MFSLLRNPAFMSASFWGGFIVSYTTAGVFCAFGVVLTLLVSLAPFVFIFFIDPFCPILHPSPWELFAPCDLSPEYWFGRARLGAAIAEFLHAAKTDPQIWAYVLSPNYGTDPEFRINTDPTNPLVSFYDPTGGVGREYSAYA